MCLSPHAARRSLLRPLRYGRGGGGEPLQPLRRGSFIQGGGRGGRACQLSAAVRSWYIRGSQGNQHGDLRPTGITPPSTPGGGQEPAGAYGQTRTRLGSAQSSLPEPRPLEEKYLLCAPPNWAGRLNDVWDLWGKEEREEEDEQY
ncbi:hypothetical protein THAOC_15647 [Thalassiosira oceanica]|uniref:Uncharacterized protein n=1 Tax=Thalassiosira oceanica TaxID=159749 RepID=K0SZV5_THAOC|nr:hypothetical protein THAOC_15647 [Thalassiosira oceanica]|eukprot:EJK63682.1 hypothetical protein THAOC_15647 [Thalassiosira oceanica]